MWYKKFMFRLSMYLMRRYVLPYHSEDDKFWRYIACCWYGLTGKFPDGSYPQSNVD